MTAFKPSSKPLAARLGLTVDGRLLILGEPPPGADDWPGVRVDTDADVVVVCPESAADIARWLPTAWHERRSDGRLWVCYRKGRKGFTRDDIGAAVDATGLDLTWFRQTAIDGTWSAIWFKHRSEFKTLNH